MTLQHILKNSSQSGKEPLASQLANGEIALNYHADGPFLTCKDTAGVVRRLTGVWVGASAPGSPTPGELWLDISITPNQLKIYKDSTDSWVFAGNVANASTSAVGVVELATDAETQAGSDTQRAVTPASLQSKISDSTVTVSATTIASSSAVKTTYDLANAALPKTGGTVTGALEIGTTGSLRFEGSTANDFETTLAVTDPTADRTITLPNVSGTVITTGDTGTVTSTMIADGTIVNSDVSASAAIAGTKISPDFGSQNVATTGTSTAARFIPTSSTVPTNGVYLPAANSVAISTGSTGRLFIDSSGRLLVGTASALSVNSLTAGVQVHATTTSNGASISIARFNNDTLGPQLILGKSRNGTVAAGTVVQNNDDLGSIHFNGDDGTDLNSPAARIQAFVDGTPGANDMPGRLVFSTTADGESSPTERMRIDASGRVGIGTTNPGSYLEVAHAGAATANLRSVTFANGIVDQNLKLAAWTGVSTNTNGNVIGSIGLSYSTIKNSFINFHRGNSTTGGFMSFSVSNDSEAARIDSSGRLLVGTSTARSNYSTHGASLAQIEGANNDGARSLSITYGKADAGGDPIIALGKHRSNSVGGTTAVVDGDGTGQIVFSGSDGTNFVTAAAIRAVVDGTPGANDMPGRIILSTTASGSSSPTERLRISSSGQIAVAGAGSASAPTITKNDDLNTGIFFPAADTIAFAEGGTESARFDSSGRLGIGTSAPSGQLDVAGSLGTFRVATTGAEVFFTRNENNDLRASGGSSAVLSIGGQSHVRFQTGSEFTERARLDSSGRLLVGTSAARTMATIGAPALLEVESSNNASLSATRTANDAFASTLVLAKVRGTAIVSTNDEVGLLSFEGHDGTAHIRAGGISCQVDGTPGANDMPGRLVFSTTADGESSPTERMRIGSNGLSILFVSTADGFQTRNSAAAGTSYACFAGRHSATSTQDGTLSYVVWSNGNVQNSNNSYGAFSDIKLKENIADANSQWDDIKALQVRNYNLIEGQTHRQIGLIAQEVEPISPGLVYESLDRDEDGNDLGTVTKSVNYSVLYMKAVKALQEAMERIETLEAKVAALESA